MDTHYYNVEIKWSRDRKGMMCSPEIIGGFVDDRSCIEIATPPEFPKGIAGIWSPEHLFTASVGACLMTTFLAIAENSNLEFMKFACQSRGKLEKADGKLMMAEILLSVHLVILQEKDLEKAKRVLRKSEEACLISNSIKSKVVMSPTITISKHEANASIAN